MGGLDKGLQPLRGKPMVGWVVARDPTATMMVLPADHLIQNTSEFQNVLTTAMHAASAK